MVEMWESQAMRHPVRRVVLVQQARDVVAEDRSTMIWCHLMAALNLDGGTVWDFLKIQHHAPLVFEDLLESFQTELLHAAEVAETSAIDQAKKE